MTLYCAKKHVPCKGKADIHWETSGVSLEFLIFGYHIDAAQQQRALNFESFVSN